MEQKMSNSDDVNKGPTKAPHGSGKHNDEKGPEQYEVGFGKPPVSGRWRTGRSGNPYGRPRKKDKVPFTGKVDPIRDIILEELDRRVSIKEGGATLEIETIRAVVRSTNVGAIKGNRFQQKLVIDAAYAAQESRRRDLENQIRDVEAYKIRWCPIFTKAAEQGGPEPSQLPHPDHVDIDPETGELAISGPFTRKEKKAWHFRKFQLRETEKLLTEAYEDLDVNPHGQHAKERVTILEQQIAQWEKEVPDRWHWREDLGFEKVYIR
jgi:hypothetical protein